MPNLSVNTNGPLGIDITTVGATKLYPLGTEVTVQDGDRFTVYRYLFAFAACAQFKLSYHDTFFFATAPTTTAILGLGNTRSLCIPQMSGGIAINQYGFYAVKGNMKVSALANCVNYANLYATATPGSVDDTSASMAKIIGLQLAQTNGGSTADVEAYAPNFIISQI